MPEIRSSRQKTIWLGLLAGLFCTFSAVASGSADVEGKPAISQGGSEAIGAESPIAAARRFAASLAGDDNRRYAEVLNAALELADTHTKEITRADGTDEEKRAGPLRPLDTALSADQVRMREAVSLKSGSSVLSDPQFLVNRRVLNTQYEKIWGGQRTPQTQFQDAVAIGSPSSWECSGTLIAPQLVITAGHCLPRVAKRIYIGVDVSRATPTDIVEVQAYRRHKGFKEVGLDKIENDLGILILERAPQRVTPRRIASSTRIDAARSILAVGFGRVDREGKYGYGIKRQVELAVASNHCSSSAARKYLCQQGFEIVSDSPRRNTCRGDSGGSVLIRDGSEWLLAAAHSRATREWRVDNIRCGSGGIHVRIDRHLRWISDVAQKFGIQGPS